MRGCAWVAPVTGGQQHKLLFFLSWKTCGKSPITLPPAPVVATLLAQLNTLLATAPKTVDFQGSALGNTDSRPTAALVQAVLCFVHLEQLRIFICHVFPFKIMTSLNMSYKWSNEIKAWKQSMLFVFCRTLSWILIWRMDNWMLSKHNFSPLARDYGLVLNAKIAKSQFNYHTGMPQNFTRSYDNTNKMLLMVS